MEEIVIKDKNEINSGQNHVKLTKLQPYIKLEEEKTDDGDPKVEMKTTVSKNNKFLKYGKMITFYYVNGEPLFCFGPHCII